MYGKLFRSDEIRAFVDGKRKATSVILKDNTVLQVWPRTADEHDTIHYDSSEQWHAAILRRWPTAEFGYGRHARRFAPKQQSASAQKTYKLRGATDYNITVPPELAERLAALRRVDEEIEDSKPHPVKSCFGSADWDHLLELGHGDILAQLSMLPQSTEVLRFQEHFPYIYTLNRQTGQMDLVRSFMGFGTGIVLIN